MKFVNAKQVFKMIGENKLTIIIDVRDTNAYKSGHLPNAINIPTEYIQESLKALYPYKDEPILIYCSKGQKSATVCKYLEKKGFSNIYNLINGLDNYSYKTI